VVPADPVTAAPDEKLVAKNVSTETPSVSTQPAAMTDAGVARDREVKAAGPAPAKNEPAKVAEPIYVRSAPPTVQKETPKPQPAAEPEVKGPAENTVAKLETPETDAGPLNVGQLLPYATNRPQPVYPSAARTIRATGVVKVEVTIDENGDVTDIQKASGHAMLQSAAKEAVRKWKFKPFMRDGQPVKATGFVNFNFNL
jgi:periplasmic protein TonB